MKQIAIFGRQPKLGLAECEVLLGAQNVELLSREAAAVNELTKPDNHGGLIKLAEKLDESSADWNKAKDWLESYILENHGDSKMKFGVSLYGKPLVRSGKQFNAQLLEIKKKLAKQDVKLRIVNRSFNPGLNAAQVKANKLTKYPNAEIVIVNTGKKLIYGRTTWVQDIDAYAKRDQQRPMRDAFVGMLPPKLAQILLNLATGQLENAQNARVLDPFCGTGVVLQEAMLMGHQAYGTDISGEMIDYSQKNLEWLNESYADLPQFEVEKGDARKHQWSSPISAVAGETYLGEPQTSVPDEASLKVLRRDSAALLGQFLENLAEQLESGTPLALAIPAWRTKNGTWIDSPVIDSINRLGYNRLSFEHIKPSDLIYFREDQFVARRILVLRKK